MKYIIPLTFLLGACVVDFCEHSYQDYNNNFPEELEQGSIETVVDPMLDDGEPCERHSQCLGGHCLRWLGGYCTTLQCNSSSNCSTQNNLIENICVHHLAGDTACYRACQDNNDCRQGYTCHERHQVCMYI